MNSDEMEEGQGGSMKQSFFHSRSSFATAARSTAAVCAAGCLLASSAMAQGVDAAPPNGTIGYVLTNLFWSIYQSDGGKEECPHGFNDGPREQFEHLYPQGRGKYTVEDTQLLLEAETWLPERVANPIAAKLPFHEVQTKKGYGLNLDGKVGAEDFTDPLTGEQGIDNEAYRVLGCIIGFRGPDGVEYIYQDRGITQDEFNRQLVELTDVDSLVNDDDVTITIYRGMDRLMMDATAKVILPGGTQRIESRWGKRLIRQVKGRIVDGVLTSEPLDQVMIPWENLGVPTHQLLRDFSLRMKLTPTSAQGLYGGYADVDNWYRYLIRNDSTHHLSNGQISGISLVRAAYAHADAYPDAQTGKNTAISVALDAKWTQVYIVHTEGEEAKNALRAEAQAERLAHGNPASTSEPKTRSTTR